MAMASAEQARKDYNHSATAYDKYNALPSGRLESELVKIALGDCTGLTILDLGGGTGIHAREAIAQGAVAVDIVDISPAMLDVAQTNDQSITDRAASKIRCFEGDVSQSLDHLPLSQQGYDVVMANWIFSFADTVEILEGMFNTITKYLKPGGLFVGVRDNDPYSPALDGRYGTSCKWVKRIPGGVKYQCVIHSDPPVEFEGASLEITYSGSTEMYQRFELIDVAIVSLDSAEIIQQDRGFWKTFVDRPCFAVVTARKKRD